MFHYLPNDLKSMVSVFDRVGAILGESDEKIQERIAKIDLAQLQQLRQLAQNFQALVEGKSEETLAKAGLTTENINKYEGAAKAIVGYANKDPRKTSNKNEGVAKKYVRPVSKGFQVGYAAFMTLRHSVNKWNLNRLKKRAENYNQKYINEVIAIPPQQIRMEPKAPSANDEKYKAVSADAKQSFEWSLLSDKGKKYANRLNKTKDKIDKLEKKLESSSISYKK